MSLPATSTAAPAISAAPAATVAPSAASTASTAGTFGLWPSLVYVQRTPFQVFLIHAVDRRLCFGLGRHFNETEATWFAAELVLENGDFADLPESTEGCPQLLFGNVARQISHKDIHMKLLG